MSSMPEEVLFHRSNLYDMLSGDEGRLYKPNYQPIEVSRDDPVATPFSEVTQRNLNTQNGSSSAQTDLPHFYNASGDRRKRRKISQERESESGQPSSPGSEEIEETRKSSSPDRVIEPPYSQSTGLMQDTHEDNAEQDKYVGLASPAPKVRRRGRPPKAATKGSQTKLFMPSAAVDDNRNNETASELSNFSGPQRRVTLKIGAGGKLVESTESPPSKATISSAKSKASTKPATGMKNLVLKNGKLGQKLIVTLRYKTLASGGDTAGPKIEDILSNKTSILKPQAAPFTTQLALNTTKATSRSTHPFFLAKASQQQIPAPGNDAIAEVKKPVAWKDLGFKTNRSIETKDTTAGIQPLWPPLSYQHVGVTERQSMLQQVDVPTGGKQKSKARNNDIVGDENILSLYARDKITGMLHDDNPSKCDKKRCTAVEALKEIFPGGEPRSHLKAVLNMRAKALGGFSAFDRAEASGPYPWTHQYGPSTCDEVLQSTTHVLYDWLSSLAVHNVKQGLDQKQTKPEPRRRKKLKKRNDEFADFIDFEEEPQETAKIKNAVLIVGPNGCGKTASVFSVAKDLGFEVFEIHSGMRRSQKDIFEKVGDMAQNHMVQGGQNTSRDSSILHDIDLPGHEEEKHQPALTSFLVHPAKKALQNTSRSATPQPNKQAQKQSLILFEEVDHVFEDDKGFWSGVQALIQNSKRPVVLTCNDLQNVPLDELDLYATLVYAAPHPDAVAERLCCMAAAEGHIIRPDAICALYESKGYDLRATVTELQFWCQMTVGSTKGGLDWFVPPISRMPANIGHAVRTFSQGAYRTGLDLFPVNFSNLEKDLKHASENLDIPCDLLLDFSWGNEIVSTGEAMDFSEALTFMESRSDNECMDSAVQPLLYSTLAAAIACVTKSIDRFGVLKAKTRCDMLSRRRTLDAFSCLDVLAVENSIHSLGHNRLAPSLDSPRSVLACDIAPYVRSIVSYDQRLEQQRDETFSSQGKKSRTTRAARAAAEGGDKASTRRERWFPQNLNLQAVLETGNEWPQ